MKAKGDEHNTLDEAFRAAFMLTGSIEVAETAVLDGIAALESIHAAGEALIFESVKSAIQRRTSFSDQCAQAFADLGTQEDASRGDRRSRCDGLPVQPGPLAAQAHRPRHQDLPVPGVRYPHHGEAV